MYSWQKEDFLEEAEESTKIIHEPTLLKEWKQENVTPTDVFKSMWNEEIISMIVEETNKYSLSKFGSQLNVTEEEIYQVLGILLLSGYVSVPNRRLFWSSYDDTNCKAVTNSGMTKNRFEAIMSSLHFADNSKRDADRLYKVRPLFEHFNKLFSEMAKPLPMTWAIDEAMEPYFGRHSLKQFIRGKPVRFGFKFWCLCSSEGLLLKFKLYEGKDTGHIDTLTVGESVVTGLAKNFVPKLSNGYIDNFFTTLPLLESFHKDNVSLTGTMRRDRVRSVPLTDFKKKPRGEAEIFSETEQALTVVHWQDNSDVIVATNKQEANAKALGKCYRWSSKHKSKVAVPQPKVIQCYNRGMGGVDQFDQFRGKYRTSFRKRVWYYPLVRFLLNATIVNGWLLYRKIQPQTELDFLRSIVNVLLKPTSTTRKYIPRQIAIEARYDGQNHDIVMGPTTRRCGVCHKGVKPLCTKCDVALHVQCWVPYHTRPRNP